jgi:hypothetical protein
VIEGVSEPIESNEQWWMAGVHMDQEHGSHGSGTQKDISSSIDKLLSI